jgi:hypothetical protein
MGADDCICVVCNNGKYYVRVVHGGNVDYAVSYGECFDTFAEAITAAHDMNYGTEGGVQVIGRNMEISLVHLKADEKYAVLHRSQRVPLAHALKYNGVEIFSIEEEALEKVQNWLNRPFLNGLCLYAEHGLVRYEM